MTGPIHPCRVDENAVRLFLKAVFAHDLAGEHFICVWTLPDKRSYWCSSVADAAVYAARRAVGGDVYVRATMVRHPPRRGRGTAEQSSALVGLFADVDVHFPGVHDDPRLPPDREGALRIVSDLGIEPSLIVDTGHGLQVWWLFKEPWLFETPAEREEAGQLVRSLGMTLAARAKNLGCRYDTGTHELSRVVRIPGTINRKADPMPVQIVHPSGRLDDNLSRYNPDDFEQFMVAEEFGGVDCASSEAELLLEKSAAPPAEKLDFLLETDQLFRRTWTHMRGDLSDQSLSGHDLAIANNLVLAGWTDQEIADAIIAHRREHGNSTDVRKALRQDYVQQTIAKARAERPTTPIVKVSAAASRCFPLTDHGNAERMARRHGVGIRYCYAFKQWLAWDGRRWRADDTGEVERLAKETARSILTEAAKETDRAARVALIKHAKSSDSAHRIRAMIELCRSEPGIAVRPAELDRDPWLFTVVNGTIELTSGRLQPHRAEDLITKMSPVEYDPTARLDLWERHLAAVTGGDKSLAAFLRKAVGYSLTGDTREEVLVFVHGPTATGKTTFVEAVKGTLGDYATTTDFESLLERRNVGGPRNDIARLAGARFVVSVEISEGRRLAQGLVKLLTGGDTVTARFLYKEAFEFRPQFKLWLVANYAPAVSDDDALWRRILRVPFIHVVAAGRRDPKIKATLRNPKIGGPAILAWAVRGCLEWQRCGLRVPDSVRDATALLRKEMNPLHDFFDECCVLAPTAWSLTENLRCVYEQWAKERGEPCLLAGRAFTDRLRDRGCVPRTRNGRRGWLGIGLRCREEDG